MSYYILAIIFNSVRSSLRFELEKISKNPYYKTRFNEWDRLK